MMARFTLLSSSFTLLFLVFYPQEVRADEFTGHKFLKWEQSSQEYLMQLSITMTGIIAAQSNAKMARCIDDWYTSSDAIQSQRYGYIRDTISEYPSFHPQSVIFAILEKECGQLAAQLD